MNASELSCGHAHEFAITAAKSGWEISDFSSLTQSEEKCRKVLQYLRGFAEITPVEYTIDCDTPPVIPGGYNWTVEEHRKGGQWKWDPAKVSLYLSEEQKGDKLIQGHKLREELKGKPVLNANVLDYLLAHQHLIPEEWKGKAVFFWGTIYRYADGILRVRYLFWGDARWSWRYRWLEYDWDADRPAACAQD